ncbi:MAG TPA: OmpA family protein [Candidatus Eisenbacteria bacterium]|jgi:outer membrane protein OmpA-like peptidoglycan-associated protein
MRGSALLLVAALAGASLARTAWTAPPVESELTPEKYRITDPAIARDRAALDGLGRRLAAFDSVASPGRVYTRELAVAWLVLAREQYALNDRSGLVDDAFDRASDLARILEARAVMLKPQPRAANGAPAIREDLWQLADSLKRTEALRCVAQEVARLEVTLVRAGHETTVCRPDDPHPQAAAATAQAARVRTLAAECILSVAIAPPPTPPPPDAAPAPVPDAVQAALRRLGAFANVHFDLNADTISVASSAVLDSVAAVMGSVPEIRATLIGHTDPRGSVAYNLALGQRRATAVRDYLVFRAGVDAGRLSIGSQGKTNPVAIGLGTREHALNRRVEILYSGPVEAQLSVRHQEGDLQLEKSRPKPPTAGRRRGTTGTRRRPAGTARPGPQTATTPR